MRKLLFLVLTSLCLVLLGCDQFLSPGGTYRDADLAFNYPPGWSISVKTVGPGTTDHVVFAHGPDNAVLVLMCMPAGSVKSLRDFADSFAKKRDEKVEQHGRIGSHSFFNPGPSTLEASRELVAGTEVDGFRQTFSLSILGIAIPFESHFSMISNTRLTLVIVTQSSIQHRAQVQTSFAAMLGSLRLLPADVPPGS
jgi:hypothetical protein